MAKMRLYYSPGSPYARKVRVVALETKLDKKMEMINVAVSPVAPNGDVEKHEEDIRQQPGVVVVESVDGLGPKGLKINTYNYLMHLKAPWIHPGFKLFFDEDTRNGWRLMSPKEVLALSPPPEYVMYE